MPMVPAKLALLIFVSLEGVGFDLPRPLHKIFVLDSMSTWAIGAFRGGNIRSGQ